MYLKVRMSYFCEAAVLFLLTWSQYLTFGLNQLLLGSNLPKRKHVCLSVSCFYNRVFKSDGLLSKVCAEIYPLFGLGHHHLCGIQSTHIPQSASGEYHVCFITLVSIKDLFPVCRVLVFRPFTHHKRLFFMEITLTYSIYVTRLLTGNLISQSNTATLIFSDQGQPFGTIDSDKYACSPLKYSLLHDVAFKNTAHCLVWLNRTHYMHSCSCH